MKENKYIIYKVFKKYTTIFNNKNKDTTKTFNHNNEDPKIDNKKELRLL